MAKLPYMQFYPADYQADVRCLSLPAQGAWMQILCALWRSPKRGVRTLSLVEWSREVGCTSKELNACLYELRSHDICEFSDEKDSKLTIISRRMKREERIRRCAAKRQQHQRDRFESRSLSRPRHGDVTPESQKSESETELRRRGREEKKERKSSGQLKALPVPGVSSATWEAYAEAYLRRYGVGPVRNGPVNAMLCTLVRKLGQEEAPQVAAFYLTHNNQFYVGRRHPVNLLVQDAEGLRTQWATGVKATMSEVRQAEFVDDAQAQVRRVEAMLAAGAL